MRTLALTNPHMHGEDVKHAQKQLNKYLGDKAAHLEPDGVFGSQTGANCKLAKLHLGYPSRDCRRTYGTVLDNYISKKSKTTAAMKKRAKSRKKLFTHHANVRAAIVAHARWGLGHASQIHYQQRRPI